MAQLNTAAWLTAEGKVPMEVKASPYLHPEKGEVLVKNAAVAANPIDWKIQSHSFVPLEYPYVLGEDIAGEVVEVGEGVQNLKVGDRVAGGVKIVGRRLASSGGFQQYTVLPEAWTFKVPASISLVAASVLPLALATAAAGLFQKNFLGLPNPTNPAAAHTGQAVVVWGGSSSVGAVSIQLARAAGVEVITTSSPRNNSFVKSLGASHVFDYNSETVVADIIAALEGKKLVGVFDTISLPDSQRKASEIAAKFNVFVALTLQPDAALETSGVKSEMVYATAIEDNHVLKAVWGDFVSPALSEGNLKPAPPAKIIGNGLEHVQAAIDANREGLSAQKAVVTLN